MDKNKSIDGLVTRRSRTKATTSASAPKTVKKTTTRTTRSKSTSNKKTIKVSSPSKAKPQKAAKPAPKNVTEDFLSPVQTFNFDEQTGELKASKEQTMNSDNPKKAKKSKKDKKAKKPVSKKRKIITGIILFVVLLLLAGVIWFIVWGNDLLSKIGNGEGNIFDLFTETYEPLKTDENGRTNILAFGTSGYNMEGSEGGGTHDGAQLTDSIMVISLNQETGDAAMLSLPRDLKVSKTCTATSKINELYWCNNMDGDNEQAGAEALMEEVGEILDIDFQYYAHLNWGSLVSIVDILGGITVTLDEDINDYGYTKAVFQAGTPYTIDGEQALGLARARHGTASGDFSRGASQQKILIGIRDKILEKQMGLTDVISLASTLGDNLRTNFSVEEMKTAAHLLTALDFDSIRQVSLIEPEKLVTTGSINGISYVLPVGGANYYTKIQEYVAKMFSNDPRQYEGASILVLNGTDTSGVASTEQASLEEEGYSTIYIDDAPAGEYEAEYTLYDLTDSKPGTKKLLEEKYHTTALSADELPAGIDTTCDFVIIIGSMPSTESE